MRVHGTTERPNEDQMILSELNRLVLYEPGEMIVQVESGMSLRSLDEMLTAQGQWIPTLQPDEDDSSTVGGALSLDTYHPRSRKMTTLRTSVLGGTYCTGEGQLFRSGSRVVKSVAGYDTHRAFVGAEGHFGVIVEVTLRVFPRPERFHRALYPLNASQLLSREDPSVLESTPDGLLVELSGFEEDIEESLVRKASGSGILLTDADWSLAVRNLRRSKPKEQGDPKAIMLRDAIQRMLDPKGVIRD